MKIFYIADIQLQPSSAQAVHVDQICSHLIKLGHEVVLYAPFEHRFASDELNYKIRLIKCPSFMQSVFFQILLCVRLLLDVREERPQVIYARHSLLLFVPNLIGTLKKVPVVLEVNGKLIEEARGQKHGWLGGALSRGGIFRGLESYNLKSAAQIITVTGGIKDFIVRAYSIAETKITVVSNGVNTELFHPQSQPEARQQVRFDEQKTYVGYLGSFYFWQGLRSVAEATRQVSQQTKSVVVVLIGEGEEAAYLNTFISENKLEESLIILSPVERKLVPTYINAFDICLSVPTNFRKGSTSPFKVYEYLACARPVIHTDIEGIREEFGDTLYYVEPESSAALAQAILDLAKTKEKGLQLGMAGRTFIKAERDWETVAQNTTLVCAKAISAAT